MTNQSQTTTAKPPLTEKGVDALFAQDRDCVSTTYWSRSPGEFINKYTGDTKGAASQIWFPGTIMEWYHTLSLEIADAVEMLALHTKNDKDLNSPILVASPDVCTILEHLVYFRPVLEDEQTNFGSTVSPEELKLIGTLSLPYAHKWADIDTVDKRVNLNLAMISGKAKDKSSVQIYKNSTWSTPAACNRILFVPNDYDKINEHAVLLVKGMNVY